MKNVASLMIGISIILVCLTSFAQVHVNGYYRKNGTYVAPHYRSSPDGNPYNNYSYPGNINPYTGKVAPGNPDTYLNNYYHHNSSYIPSTYIPPPTTSSNTPFTYSPPITPIHTPSTNGSGSSYTQSATSSNYYRENNLTSGNQDLLNNMIYVSAVNKLNVRKYPNNNAEVLYTLEYNQRVIILSIENYPWCKVMLFYNDLSGKQIVGEGHVHSQYLTHANGVSSSYYDKPNLTPNTSQNNTDTYIESKIINDLPYDTYIKKTTIRIPLRQGPGLNFSEVYDCPEESKITVLKKGPLFYYVDINNIKGYISKDALIEQ